MKKNYLGLKFGWIKCWHFEEDFVNEHETLIDKLNALDDEVCNGNYTMFDIDDSRDDENLRRKQNEKLIEILDELYDTKQVQIYNDFDGTNYGKKRYRKYLLGE